MSAKWRKKKKKPRKRKVAYRRDNIRFFRKKVIPALKIVLIIGLIITGLVLGYKKGLPKLMDTFGIEWPPATPTPIPPTPAPTATPHPMQLISPADLQKEIVPDAAAKYVTDPFCYGDDIIYAAGYDKDGPRYDKLYLFDITTKTNEQMSMIELQNDDFFQPIMNESWIVVLDQKKDGGGLIRAIDRETNQVKTIKEYYDGKPTLSMSGDHLIWTERTGSRMNKLYLYELATGENVTLATFGNSAYGFSAGDIGGDEIVWATYGVKSTSSEAMDQSSIHYIRLDQAEKGVQIYESDTYVHNPMTNGKERVWIDQNIGPDPSLYLSQDGQPAKKIDTDVVSYGIGEDFVAYSKNEELWIYSWNGPEPYSRRISMEGERCILAGVSDRTVFWYVAGMNIDHDILKYAQIIK